MASGSENLLQYTILFKQTLQIPFMDEAFIGRGERKLLQFAIITGFFKANILVM